MMKQVWWPHKEIYLTKSGGASFRPLDQVLSEAGADYTLG